MTMTKKESARMAALEARLDAANVERDAANVERDAANVRAAAAGSKNEKFDNAMKSEMPRFKAFASVAKSIKTLREELARMDNASIVVAATAGEIITALESFIVARDSDDADAGIVNLRNAQNLMDRHRDEMNTLFTAHGIGILSNIRNAHTSIITKPKS